MTIEERLADLERRMEQVKSSPNQARNLAALLNKHARDAVTQCAVLRCTMTRRRKQ